MSFVFVVDANRQPLNPVHPGEARRLLSQGKAAVLRRFPFTILLKRVVEHPYLAPLRLKIDPGSKTTGLALVQETIGKVVWAAELTHRGQAIKKALDSRRAIRKSRRQRHTRYRPPRFQNRRRPAGWLAPSLVSRIHNIVTWARRVMRLCPLTALSQELVRFDFQQMENPEIAGVEYQQGERAGYEVREYLLAKWQRRCAYCGIQDVPLQVEHIHSRAHGGTNRMGNLCLACEPCNRAKGTQDIRVFLADRPAVLTRILAQAKAPRKDATVVNATRWALYERLQALGLPVEVGSGGLTKFNRVSRGLPKTHWLDAACVGQRTPPVLHVSGVVPLFITAQGHGSRQMRNVTAQGFPRGGPKGTKKVKGFQTGDLVRAVVPAGSKAGTHVGRASIRASGSFDIRTPTGRVQGISHRFCTPIHRSDGYRYTTGANHADTPPHPPKKERVIPPPLETRGAS